MNFHQMLSIGRINRFISPIFYRVRAILLFSALDRLVCLVFLLFLGSLIFLSSGCTRQHYRQQADREAYGLLASAASDPRWKLDDYRISPSPQSRMFNPYSADCEPMPKDDPASHCKMLRVDGKRGSKHWTDCGCRHCVENEAWKQYLLYNEKGEVSLDKDGAMDLALLHSPEYQSALENLYIAALKVSNERFRFDVQFYGGESLLYSANGRLTDRYGSFLENDLELEARKTFASGAELVVGLANSITWSFNGQNSWYADSLINFGFVQPLLRGAGRKIVLEKLTQSERDFLAALRQMVFFQQGFYTKIVTGQGAQSAPVGDIRANFTPTYSGGIYSLLADQIQIQNQRQNIVGLEENLDRFEAFFQAGKLDDIYQVAQTRQTLLNSESSLLSKIGTYETNLDTYIRSLGLPSELKVAINDPLMEPFRLISSSLLELQEKNNRLLSEVRRVDSALDPQFGTKLLDLIEGARGEIQGLKHDLERMQKSKPQRMDELKLLALDLHSGEAIQERIDPEIYNVNEYESRIKKLREVDVPKNLEKLDAAFHLIQLIAKNDVSQVREMLRNNRFSRADRDALERLQIDLLLASDVEDEAKQRRMELERARETLEALREGIEPPPVTSTPVSPERKAIRETIVSLRQKDEYRDFVRRILSAFQSELSALSLLQTRARLDSICLVPANIAAEDAFKIARENRLDWMNRRAALVDSWRQIEIAANNLRGTLNVKVEGEIGTIDRKGVRFDSDQGKLRVGLEWDSPLTRHEEMVEYRQAQIDYQMARREYYSYVDSVQAELRKILRNLRINRIDFELKRHSILIATIQVDVAQLKLVRPPERGKKIDTNTARDVINALDDLMGRQNQFLTTWVAYQTQRMLLDLNMGTMELDSRGHWIDPGTITRDRTGRVAMWNNQYGGAYAKESKLVPSQNGCSKKKKKQQSTISYFTEQDQSSPKLVTESTGPSKSVIPSAPRLEPEGEPIDAPMMLPFPVESKEMLPAAPLQPTRKSPTPVNSKAKPTQPKKETQQKTLPESVPKQVEKAVVTEKTGKPNKVQEMVPSTRRRAPLSTDTIPDQKLMPIQPLKLKDAPAPPKTPE